MAHAPKTLICRNCRDEFREKLANAPGYRDQCPECSAAQPEPFRYRAGQAEDESGSTFEIQRRPIVCRVEQELVEEICASDLSFPALLSELVALQQAA